MLRTDSGRSLGLLRPDIKDAPSARPVLREQTECVQLKAVEDERGVSRRSLDCIMVSGSDCLQLDQGSLVFSSDGNFALPSIGGSSGVLEFHDRWARGA